MPNYSPPDYDIWESENVFYLKSHPLRITKLLAQYELYKKILKLPGHILECGVYKGSSLMRWAHFRNSVEDNHTRSIYGFDAFGSFPSEGLKSDYDKKFVSEYDDGGGVGIDEKILEKLFIEKKITNVHLLKGNVLTTADEFVKNNKNLEIALLHLDLDVYEPTLHTLKVFSRYMVKGGFVLIDDYNTFDGATRATDDFIKGTSLKLEKLSKHLKQVFIRF